MRHLLLRIARRLPLREITADGEPYLERYFVCRVFGWNVYLHRFLASDPDRGLHDHPWRLALSLILLGQYQELRRDGLHLRLWLNVIHGDTFHRVLVEDGAEVWTLFAHGSRVKRWGFWRESDGQNITGIGPSGPFAYKAVPSATWRAHDSASEDWWKKA